jgi:hypothetical protein
VTVSEKCHLSGYDTGRGEKWRGWRENLMEII